ncbi:uncharacterized protein P884DRAFT_265273 [Thermothelomyces heterothallicus CBS 202.75]|uniref:uncharacterized protein n=1 Tax=Thermothelomyces heterothallicus CBS 202.75 TaxID=1149848 RepID=UPI00374358E0
MSGLACLPASIYLLCLPDIAAVELSPLDHVSQPYAGEKKNFLQTLSYFGQTCSEITLRWHSRNHISEWRRGRKFLIPLSRHSLSSFNPTSTSPSRCSPHSCYPSLPLPIDQCE